MGRVGEASIIAVADVSRFAAQLQAELNRAIAGITLDTGNLGRQLSNGIRDGVNQANTELQRLQTTSDQVADRVASGMDSAANRMAASFRTAGAAMAGVGESMSMALTLPLVGLGALTLNTAGDFEKAMNAVKAATEATAPQFAALRKQAIDLGSTTAFSAQEAAAGMNVLATAGFDVTEIMAALPGVLDMAAAGTVSISTAADIAGSILNGFGMSASRVGEINDILARTFLSTATSLEDLGQSFKYVGPVAASVGLSFVETAAAIGLLGNAGIKGGEGGTALRGAISMLLKPSSDAETIMKKLGITVLDASGKMVPLVNIVQQLEKSGATTTDMITLFGQEAGPGMMALVSQGSVALSELTTQLSNAGGTAQRVAKTQMEGLNGSLDELSSSAEGLMIAIGDAGLLRWATALSRELTSLTMAAAKLSPALLGAATVAAIVLAALGPILVVVGKIVESIGILIPIFVKLSKVLKTFGVAAYGFFVTPAGLVVLAVIAIVAAMVIAYKYSDRFRAVVQSAFAAIGSAASRLWTGYIQPAFAAIRVALIQVGVFFVQLWQYAQPVFQALGQAVMSAWTSAIRPALGYIGAMLTSVGVAIADLWSTSIQPYLSMIMGMFGKLGDAIGGWWSKNGEGAFQAAAAGISWFWNSVTLPALTAFMGILKVVATIGAWVWTSVFIPAVRLAVEIMKEIWATGLVLWAVLQPVFNGIKNVAVAAFNGIVDAGTRIWGVLGPVFTSIGASVSSTWTSVVIPAFRAFMAVLNGAGALLMWFWNNVSKPVFDGIRATIQGVATVIAWLWTSVFQPVFSAIGAIAMWLWTSVIQPAFSGIMAVISGVIGVVQWLWNTFGPIVMAIGNLVITIFGGVFTMVFGVVRLLFAGLVVALQLLWAVLGPIFMAIGALVVMVWTGLIWPALQAFGSAIAWLWGYIQPVLAAIGAVFVWLWSNVIQPVFSAIGTKITEWWNFMSLVFAAVVAIVKSGIAGITAAAGGVAEFVNSISTHFQNAVNSVRDKINSMISFVRSIPGAVISAVGNIGSLLYNAGSNVIDGLINGISSRIGALQSKISEAAGAIRDALPFSPAKVGPLSGHGDPTISGGKIANMLASGIDANIPALREAASKMAGALMLQPARVAGGALLAEPLVAAVGAAGGGGAAAVPAGDTINITVNSLDPKGAAAAVMDAIAAWERSNGKTWRTA
jgi:TP901 family phage tail tape measure protein